MGALCEASSRLTLSMIEKSHERKRKLSTASSSKRSATSPGSLPTGPTHIHTSASSTPEIAVASEKKIRGFERSANIFLCRDDVTASKLVHISVLGDRELLRGAEEGQGKREWLLIPRERNEEGRRKMVQN